MSGIWLVRGGGSLILAGLGLVGAAYTTKPPSLTDDPLFRLGVVLVSIGCVAIVLGFLLRQPAPRLRVKIPKQLPLRPGLSDLLTLMQHRPIDRDYRRTGGFGMPVGSQTVHVLRLPVVNIGSVRADAVQADITDLTILRRVRTRGQPRVIVDTRRVNIPLQWRREVVATKHQASIPPRGGSEDVCMLEWESLGPGSRTVYMPAMDWNGPVRVRVIVSAPGARPRALRLRLEGIQGNEGNPRMSRVRWWHRLRGRTG
jgi:hypothetical protein